MRVQLFFILIISGIIVGCALPNSRGSDSLVPPVAEQLGSSLDLENLNGECEVLLRKSGDTQISFLGHVSESTNDSVTLINPIKFARKTSSPAIPIVGNLFVNKSIGSEQVEGKVTVKRNEISQIQER